MLGTPVTQSQPDRLFHALDGYTIRVPAGAWRLHVYSVTQVDNRLWIQLDAIGPTTCTLTVRQPTAADPVAVIACLIRYLQQWEGECDEIVAHGVLETRPQA
jgi:hypothetical protein